MSKSAESPEQMPETSERDDDALESLQILLGGACSMLRSVVESADGHYLRNSTQNVWIINEGLADDTTDYDFNHTLRNKMRLSVSKVGAPEAISGRVTLVRGSIGLGTYEEFSFRDQDPEDDLAIEAEFTKKTRTTREEYREGPELTWEDMQKLNEWIKELEALTGVNDD